MSNLPPRTSPFFMMALCHELAQKMEAKHIAIVLLADSHLGMPEPVAIKASEPVTSPIPRHKSTHPADIQNRRRRRKQGL